MRVATGLECPCIHERLVNMPTQTYPLAIHKGRPGMQRLPGDRSWTVSGVCEAGIMTGHKGERKQNHQSSSALGTGGHRTKIPGEHNLLVTERHTSVTGNTCNEIPPSQNMKPAHHEHFADGPVHQQHPRLPNPSRFTGFVVREHLASDERGRSVSQSSGSGKTLRQKFSHHQRQLCFLRCVRMTTDLPMDCRRAP